jgi:hypothetical protein
VGDDPIRVGEWPGGKRVGREPGVHEGDRAFDALVTEIWEEVPELVGREHSLVDEGSRRKRRKVGVPELVLDSLSKDECDPVEIDAGGISGDPRRVGGQEELLEAGRDLHRGLPGLGEVRRHNSPTAHEESLFPGDPFYLGARHRRGARLDRQERHAGDVAPAFGKRERHDRAEESVRHLDQDPCTVTGLGIGTEGASMREVLERGEPEVDDLVGRGALQVGDKRDPARVVFEARVVKAWVLVLIFHGVPCFVSPSGDGYPRSCTFGTSLARDGEFTRASPATPSRAGRTSGPALGETRPQEAGEL